MSEGKKWKEDRSWQKGGIWKAHGRLKWREGCGLLLPLAVPALPARPTEISEQIRKGVVSEAVA